MPAGLLRFVPVWLHRSAKFRVGCRFQTLAVIWLFVFCVFDNNYSCSSLIISMKRLRKIAPWILIAAYLPLLVSLTFHTHTESRPVAATCPDCAHHVAHPAHLAEAVVMAHNCVYCQLASSFYYRPEQPVLVAQLPLVRIVVADRDRMVNCQVHGLSPLRSPPSLCFV